MGKGPDSLAIAVTLIITLALRTILAFVLTKLLQSYVRDRVNERATVCAVNHSSYILVLQCVPAHAVSKRPLVSAMHGHAAFGE